MASGLPVRNGDAHAKEVCMLSVKLLVAARNLVSSPLKLVVLPRIGINSGRLAEEQGSQPWEMLEQIVRSRVTGAVATGVIGSEPRYCM